MWIDLGFLLIRFGRLIMVSGQSYGIYLAWRRFPDGPARFQNRFEREMWLCFSADGGTTLQNKHNLKTAARS